MVDWVRPFLGWGGGAGKWQVQQTHSGDEAVYLGQDSKNDSSKKYDEVRPVLEISKGLLFPRGKNNPRNTIPPAPRASTVVTAG